MRETKVGDRVVYAHKDGGFNALVTAVQGTKNHQINLIYVDPRNGDVIEKTSVPNINHSHEEKEVDQIVKPGVEVTDVREVITKAGTKVKIGKVKRMVSKPHGHWRR